jgi:hypothetical protein
MPVKSTPRPCKVCGKIFQPFTQAVRNGYGLFCSQTCCYEGRRRPAKTVPGPAELAWLEANPGCRLVPLSRGKFAVIDAADEGRVSQHAWHYRLTKGREYAVMSKGGRPGQPRLPLHRFLLGAADEVMVDHIDGDGLNNRRSNLRLATNAENSRNQKKRKVPNASSSFKGVHHHEGGKWIARITVNYRNIRLGSFDTEVEAARAYDAAARRHFGEFARVNFPD